MPLGLWTSALRHSLSEKRDKWALNLLPTLGRDTCKKQSSRTRFQTGSCGSPKPVSPRPESIWRIIYFFPLLSISCPSGAVAQHLWETTQLSSCGCFKQEVPHLRRLHQCDSERAQREGERDEASGKKPLKDSYSLCRTQKTEMSILCSSTGWLNRWRASSMYLLLSHQRCWGVQSSRGSEFDCSVLVDAPQGPSNGSKLKVTKAHEQNRPNNKSPNGKMAWNVSNKPWEWAIMDSEGRSSGQGKRKKHVYRKLAEHVEGAEQFPKPQKMSRQPILGRLDRITTCWLRSLDNYKLVWN